MNRFKLWSGGLAASLLVLVTASAVAQGAGEWTMTGRTPDLQRYSPLTQINKANVKSLKAAWTFSTGVLNGHEGNPLVINNVMYVHSAFPNIVFALDLTKDGAPMIWKHNPSQPAEAKRPEPREPNKPRARSDAATDPTSGPVTHPAQVR